MSRGGVLELAALDVVSLDEGESLESCFGVVECPAELVREHLRLVDLLGPFGA